MNRLVIATTNDERLMTFGPVSETTAEKLMLALVMRLDVVGVKVEIVRSVIGDR